jgi:hypothetical protein
VVSIRSPQSSTARFTKDRPPNLDQQMVTALQSPKQIGIIAGGP